MMPELTLRLFVTLLAAAAPTVIAAPTADCLVIAHRGASGYLPEHTLPAYRLAIQLGADYLEPDLVMTRDGVLVARHDRALGASTNVSALPRFAARRRPEASGVPRVTDDWFVEDFTLAELKELRRGNAAFNDQFPVPTLGEIIALLRDEVTPGGRAVGIYPELKEPALFRARGLDPERALPAALDTAGLAHEDSPVIIQSFDAESLKRLRPRTGLPLVQLVEGPAPDGEALAGGR